MSARSAADRRKYTADDIQVITDPLAWMRARPDMFFPQGRFSAAAAATQIVGEALSCQAVRDVAVERWGNWWIVSSRGDWLPSGDVLKLFRQIVPFPEAGANSMRAEVLLAAFCRDVITQAQGKRLVIQGDPEGELLNHLDQLAPEGRVVAFRD